MSEVESSNVKNKHIICSDTAGHYKVFTKKGVSLNLITQHVFLIFDTDKPVVIKPVSRPLIHFKA